MLADEHHQRIRQLFKSPVLIAALEVSAPQVRVRHRGVHDLQGGVHTGDGELTRFNAFDDDPSEHCVVSATQFLDPVALCVRPFVWRQEQS
jgi:hypothetical protein